MGAPGAGCADPTQQGIARHTGGEEESPVSASEAGSQEDVVPLRARLQRFQSVQDFIAGFNRYVTTNAILLPTPSPREVGTRLHVHLEIASGDVVFACLGVVHDHKLGPNGKPVAMTIRLQSVDAGFSDTFDQMLEAKRERTGAYATVGEADAAAGPARPSAPEPAERAAAEASAHERETLRGGAPAESAADSDESALGPATPSEATASPEAAADAAPARPAWLPPVAAPKEDVGIEEDDVDALFDAFDASFDQIIAGPSDGGAGEDDSDAASVAPRLASITPPDASDAADDDFGRDAPAQRTMMGLKPVNLEDGLALLRQKKAEELAALSATASATIDDAPDLPGPEDEDALPFASEPPAATRGAPARTMLGLPATEIAEAARRAKQAADAAAAAPIDPSEALGDRLADTSPPGLPEPPASASQPLAQLQFKKVARSPGDSQLTGEIVERNRSESAADTTPPADPAADDAASGPARPRTQAILAALVADEDPQISSGDALDMLSRDDEPDDDEPRGDAALDALVGDVKAPPPDLEEAGVLPPFTPTDLAPREAPKGFFGKIIAFFKRLFGG